jgi:hypothetical protein
MEIKNFLKEKILLLYLSDCMLLSCCLHFTISNVEKTMSSKQFILCRGLCKWTKGSNKNWENMAAV